MLPDQPADLTVEPSIHAELDAALTGMAGRSAPEAKTHLPDPFPNRDWQAT
jgi:hypothetical protein